MILKEAVYEECPHCNRRTGNTFSEAVIGCDYCKEIITQEYPLNLRVFYERSEVDELQLCSWLCLWRKLRETETAGKPFAFIELPTIDSIESLKEFTLTRKVDQ
jgi:hypothetical protein